MPAKKPVFEERSYLYEALVRFGHEGLVGIHVCYLTEILRDGEVIQAKECDPVPIKDVAELQAVFGQAAIDFADAFATAQTERDAAVEAVDGLKGERDAALKKVKALERERDKAVAERDEALKGQGKA